VDRDSATQSSSFRFPGNGKPAEGVIITTPAGRGNQLEFTYFQTKAQGNVLAPVNTTLFTQFYPQSDIINGTYKIQHGKAVWNYLSYPDPPGTSKFRFRTMWGVSYTSINARFNTPQDYATSPVEGSRTLIYPSLGVGVEYHFSRNFYFEMRGSGFILPHKSAQGDGEAKISARFGRLDILVGGRDFYFKTSPNKDYYFKANMWGPYGGLRWTFK
jgi:hypothetical protein